MTFTGLLHMLELLVIILDTGLAASKDLGPPVPPIRDWHKSPGRWDYKYTHGEWDYWQTDFIELGRNAMIGTLLKKHFGDRAETPRILDVGCGYGMQLEHLPRKWEAHYTGIDFSPAAIERAKAKHRRFQHATFLNISVEAYTPPSPTARFDAIVFNEVLYYVNLTDTLPRFASYLASPHGLVVASTYAQGRTKNDYLYPRMLQYYTLVDQVAMTRPSDGLTFNISALRPRK
jgi:2-polyprenyl-3-methyl-5-hydroxy-6-metoxy-1,4-benzoquinol methylase